MATIYDVFVSERLKNVYAFHWINCSTCSNTELLIFRSTEFNLLVFSQRQLSIILSGSLSLIYAYPFWENGTHKII